MSRSMWRRAAVVLGVGWGLIGAFGLGQAAGAEMLFTDNVRIKKGFQPKLLLQQGNDGPTWSVDNTNGVFVIHGPSGESRLSLKDNSSTYIFVDFDSKFYISNELNSTLSLYTHENMLVPRQAWDVNGNAFAFTLHDVGDSTVPDPVLIPFTVEARTPSNTLYLDNTGHVGIGTSKPNLIHDTSLNGDARHLNIRSTAGTARNIVQGDTAAESYLVHTGGSSGRKVVRTRVAGGKYLISTMSDDLASNTEVPFSIDLSSKNVGIKTASPAKPFQVGDAGANDGNGAHVTAGGVWTNASSRSVKNDIQPITTEQARETVRALQPVGYRYKNEPEEKYVGFIAEDVPELVATNDRKSLASMDITAVLTRVVQDQDRLLDQQRQTLTRQEQKNAEQQQMIVQQQQMLTQQQTLLSALNKRLTDLEQESGSRGRSEQPVER